MDFGSKISQFLQNVGQGAKNYWNNAVNAVGNEVQQLPQQIGNVASAVGNEVQQLPQQVQSVAQPVAQAISPFAQNLFNGASQQVGNVLQGKSVFGNQVPFGINNPLAPAPRVDFTSGINTGNPVTDFLAKTAAGVPESILNAPSDVQQGIGQTGQDIMSGQILKPQVAASDVAKVGLPIATIATLPVGGEAAGGILENVGKQGFADALRQGALTGAGYGAGFGFGGGLASGRNITDPTQYFTNLGENTALGAGTGAVLGGGLAGITHGVGAASDAFHQQVAQQFPQDIANNDPAVTNNEAIAPYKRAFQLVNDPATQKEIYNAVSSVKAGDIGNPDANYTLNTVSNAFLPKGLTDKLNSVQLADTWDYLLSRFNGAVPQNVPSWMGNFDKAIFDTTGNRIASAGFIKPDELIPGVKQEPSLSDQNVKSLGEIIKQRQGSMDAAKAQLDNLINYPKRLQEMGYTSDQIDKINAVEARNIIDNNIPPFAHESFPQPKKGFNLTKEDLVQPGQIDQTILPNKRNATPILTQPEVPTKGNIFSKYNDVFAPLKNQSEAFQKATSAFDATRKVSEVDANNVNLKLKSMVDNLGIKPKQEEALVYYSQDPTPATIKDLQQRGYPIDQALVDKAKPLLDMHRQLEDQRLARANEAGVDTAYRQNHIYQSYAQSPQEVQAALEGAGLNRKPGFTFHKEIPTFLAAKDKLNLDPKYSTFGQLQGLAEKQLGDAVANRNFLDYLVKSKSVLPGSEAPRGWKPIQSDYFPRDSGNEPYYAAPDKARVLNNIFGGVPEAPEQAALRVAGNLSAKAQATLLTTPTYSVHGFTIAQAGKDLATGLGEVASGHPITGIKTASAPIRAMARAFLPGWSEGFEKSNAESIRQMASEGIGYTGKFDFAGLQKNTALDKGVVGNTVDALKSPLKTAGNAYEKAEQAIVGTPTFQKFMFQRRVSLFNAFRDALTSRGMPLNDAVHEAATQLKNYDGIVNELGRDPGVNNALKTFLFAPKYRESVMGSLINTIKGTAQFTNKDYQYSRSLLLGMAATYFAYNVLNRLYNNGKNLWENPPGKQFELVIPQKDNPGKYYSIPWMPGITTVPRAIAGTISALAQGDLKTATQQASGLLSSPLQTLGQTITGKDYFGRDIYDKSKPTIPQAAGYIASNLLVPGSVNEVGKFLEDQYAGKNPNPAVTAARMAQLPLKEGTMPNPYFTSRDAGNATLNQQQQTIADYYNTSVAKGGPSSKEKAAMAFNNPWLLDYARANNLASNPNDPLWSRSPEDIKAYLAYQQLTDPTIKAQVRVKYPWIPQVEQQVSDQIQSNMETSNQNKQQMLNNQQSSLLYALYNKLGLPQTPAATLTPVTPQSAPSPMSQLTPEQVQIASAYTAAPAGSAARKQLLAQNPWLQNYWNQNSTYFAQNPVQLGGVLGNFLKSQGIDTTVPSTTNSSYYARKSYPALNFIKGKTNFRGTALSFTKAGGVKSGIPKLKSSSKSFTTTSSKTKPVSLKTPSFTTPRNAFSLKGKQFSLRAHL